MIFGIITPIFEQSKYLLPALASVQSNNHKIIYELQQSVQGECFELPHQFCDGIRVVREKDSGMYEAITKGFNRLCCEHPEIEILAWLNSDEQYLSGAIDVVAEFFAEHPEVDIVYGDYIQLDADGKPCSIRREIPPHLFYLVHGVNYIMSCTVFMRRHVWECGVKLDTSYKYVADKKFYVENFRKGYKLAHIPRLIGAYTSTGENLSLNQEATHAEQARLRSELGSWCAPFRKLVRILRCINKLFCGCYRRNNIRFGYKDMSGEPKEFSGFLSNRWQ